MNTKNSFALLSAMVVAATVIFLGSVKKAGYEERLLVDFSSPPPLAVFQLRKGLSSALRAIADALTPPPIQMLDIAFQYQTTILAYSCQKFGIPDLLATGPKTAHEIAEHIQTTDVQRVERLMYAMASEKITALDHDGERFVNSPLSATLRTDHPNSVAGMVGLMVELFWDNWKLLPLMFGPNAKDNVWDLSFPNHTLVEGGMWKLFNDHPLHEQQFARAMMALEGLGGKAMAQDGPFHKFDRVVDMGGGVGHFLHKILMMFPDMEGILFDLPSVVENAKSFWLEPDGRFHSASTEERVKLMAGSIFDVSTFPDAKDGDAFYFRYIFHQFGDEDCLMILRNLRKTIGLKRVTLLLGETAMPDRGTVGQPSLKHHKDIQMMVMSGNGLERTPAMFRALFEEAGFRFNEIHPTRSTLHWLEAVPV